MGSGTTCNILYTHTKISFNKIHNKRKSLLVDVSEFVKQAGKLAKREQSVKRGRGCHARCGLTSMLYLSIYGIPLNGLEDIYRYYVKKFN